MSKINARVGWDFRVSTPPELGEILADYMDGIGRTTSKDWNGLPFVSPMPMHILQALHEAGFRGTCTITLEVKE